MNEEQFKELKQEILDRAHKAEACTEQYGRAYKSETARQLLTVVKDNFGWACNHNVLTVDLIEKYKDTFAENQIYANQSVQDGYLLCDNALVYASGNALVEASDNATVEASGNATVKAWGNATVYASDNAYTSRPPMGNARFAIPIGTLTAHQPANIINP